MTTQYLQRTWSNESDEDKRRQRASICGLSALVEAQCVFLAETSNPHQFAPALTTPLAPTIILKIIFNKGYYALAASFSRLFAFVVVVSAACTAGTPSTGAATGRVRVLATTGLVGDAVQRVGSDAIDIALLLPPDADPHAYDLQPQDLVRVADADIVFANGAGLETFLDRLVTSAGGDAWVVSVSEGVPLRTPSGAHAGETDPHVWLDPTNVEIWTQNIEAALAQFDPAGAKTYASNAAQYRAELAALDAWIEMQLSAIPPADRLIVTDHDELGYFADKYKFEIVGTIVPAYSTVAEPSAQQIADVENAVHGLGASAIFVGTPVNRDLAAQVAADTGVELVGLYTASLSLPDGPAATYIDMMHYNVSAIVDALSR